MLDFTSALYLGLRHPSRSLKPWAQLTTGMPAALAESTSARTVAHRLARLQGCERGILSPSTLHLFWDLFGLLASDGVAIYMDAGVYPIARWGIERAAGRGVSAITFPQHDPDALRRQLKKNASLRLRPLVVTDGYSPGCGESAPIAAYLENVRAVGGLLIIDDTQALGILGTPARISPYGTGGGGSLRWNNVTGSDIVVISSLAKGFGVPIAVLSGNNQLIRYFEEKSETRVHCSPPSNAVIHAAGHALSENQIHGDALRLRLSQLVCYFRKRLAEAGFAVTGGLFPVQTLASKPNFDAVTLYHQMLRAGVRTVLHHARTGHGARISFIITAHHRPGDIDRVVDSLIHCAYQKGVKK